MWLYGGEKYTELELRDGGRLQRLQNAVLGGGHAVGGDAEGSRDVGDAGGGVAGDAGGVGSKTAGKGPGTQEHAGHAVAVEAGDDVLAWLVRQRTHVGQGVVRVAEDAGPHMVGVGGHTLPGVEHLLEVAREVGLGARDEGAVVDDVVEAVLVGEDVFLGAAEDDRPVWAVDEVVRVCAGKADPVRVGEVRGPIRRRDRHDVAAGALDGDDLVAEPGLHGRRVGVGGQHQPAGDNGAARGPHQVPAVAEPLRGDNGGVCLEVEPRGHGLAQHRGHQLVRPQLARRVRDTHRRAVDLRDDAGSVALRELHVLLAPHVRVLAHLRVVGDGPLGCGAVHVHVARPCQHKVAVDLLSLHELLHRLEVGVLKVDDLRSTRLAVLLPEVVVRVVEVGLEVAAVPGRGAAADVPGLEHEHAALELRQQVVRRRGAGVAGADNDDVGLRRELRRAAERGKVVLGREPERLGGVGDRK